MCQIQGIRNQAKELKPLPVETGGELLPNGAKIKEQRGERRNDREVRMMHASCEQDDDGKRKEKRNGFGLAPRPVGCNAKQEGIPKRQEEACKDLRAIC